MSNASKLRSFAIAAEHVATLIPRLTAAKAIRKAEADLLIGQLKSGAETALDVAQSLERA